MSTSHRAEAYSSQRGLSNFHTQRMELYLGVSELLSRPPARLDLERLRMIRGVRRPWRDELRSLQELTGSLRAAEPEVVATEYQKLFRGTPTAVSLRCPLPSSEVRRAAYAAALLPSEDERPVELRALAVLADRTARAIASSDLPEAAALCDLQSRFLKSEAAECLGRLGAELEGVGLPFYARIGRALRWQIEDDLHLLGAPTDSVSAPAYR